ncbi:unnamed protein product [Rhizophagus irregularis]|nr:unnamed protein product [Rhizophagus irregularis]
MPIQIFGDLFDPALYLPSILSSSSWPNLHNGHNVSCGHNLDYWIASWVARSARITASQSFSYKREKVGVPISTAKGSQLRIVFSRQTSKEFEPSSSIILEQLVLESDSLWEDTEGETSPWSFPLMTLNWQYSRRHLAFSCLIHEVFFLAKE